MKWYERTTFCIFVFLFSWLVITEARAGTEITVSAALSLKNPFEAIGRIYEKRRSGSKVSFNFAASGILQKQIEAGAPAESEVQSC